MGNRKIDLVYLWVDGNDETWRTEKAKYISASKSIGRETYYDAIASSRWRNNDELRYSLRSVEKFIPWINHIFIITGFGQSPEWLDTENKKITIVPDSSIMPTTALPTFNPSAIEMCMANIPNLSEHFLLASDDMFFGRPLLPGFFFDRRGRSIVWYVKHKKDAKRSDLWLENLTNYNESAKLMHSIFGANFSDMEPAGCIDPYIKSSVLATCNHPKIAKKIYSQIVTQRLRTTHGIQRWIFTMYDRVHKNCRLKCVRNTFGFKRRNAPIYCLDAMAARLDTLNPPLYCINDTNLTTDEMLHNNQKFLKSKFPKKSSFEK